MEYQRVASLSLQYQRSATCAAKAPRCPVAAAGVKRCSAVSLVKPTGGGCSLHHLPPFKTLKGTRGIIELA